MIAHGQVRKLLASSVPLSSAALRQELGRWLQGFGPNKAELKALRRVLALAHAVVDELQGAIGVPMGDR